MPKQPNILTRYLIPADEPFKGFISSSLSPEGIVAFTGGLTLEEYEEQQGKKFTVLSDDEFLKLVDDFQKSLITAPSEIDEDTYTNALEVLPPARYHTHEDVTLFHLKEPYSGTLVSWYATFAGRYFEFVDQSYQTSQILSEKIKATLRGILAAEQVISNKPSRADRFIAEMINKDPDLLLADPGNPNVMQPHL